MLPPAASQHCALLPPGLSAVAASRLLLLAVAGRLEPPSSTALPPFQLCCSSWQPCMHEQQQWGSQHGRARCQRTHPCICRRRAASHAHLCLPLRECARGRLHICIAAHGAAVEA